MMRIPGTGAIPLAALMVATMCFAEADSYRLAGTIDGGARGWLALLELPNGEQRVLGKDDAIPGGSIVDIGNKWVRLRDQSGELVLQLEGSASRDSFAAEQTGFADFWASRELRSSIDELGRSAKSDAQVAGAIKLLLRIPAIGQIESIDDEPAISGRQTLRLLEEALDSGSPARIAVSGIEGFDAVYLMPAPEGPDG